jgi:hypothetical protein
MFVRLEVNMRQSLLAALFLFSLSACGGTNPGGGTRTLFVRAVAESDGTTEGSTMAVEVREGASTGNLITDAVVTVRGAKTGEFNLAWEGVTFGNFTAGAYTKRQLPWDRSWSMTIKRGNDGLDFALEAPGITTITEPLSGANFDRAAGTPLVIKWKDADGVHADTVEIDLSRAGYDQVLTEDTLEHTVEVNRMVAGTGERIDIRRYNDVNLAGGSAGSTFRATTRHRVTFNVQ